MTTIQDIITRWDAGDGKPYKGSLIDWSAYGGNGVAPPADIGCMCAQGQVLHLLGGWSPRKLSDAKQRDADLETARLLDISTAHAILLRRVNDSVDGAPSIVLTHPEKILGDQAPILLAFWKHIDRMTASDWKKTTAGVAAGEAAGDAWEAAGDAWEAAGDAWEAAGDAWAAAREAAWAAAGVAAREAAWEAAWEAAGDAWAAWAATRASYEIQGAELMRERSKSFFFLPLFGFASPEENREIGLGG